MVKLAIAPCVSNIITRGPTAEVRVGLQKVAMIYNFTFRVLTESGA